MKKNAYEILLEELKEEDYEIQSNYFLSMKNGDLLNYRHINLLDANEVPIEVVKEVNKALSDISAMALRFRELHIDRSVFLQRLNSMKTFYELEEQRTEAREVEALFLLAKELDSQIVTITDYPMLFAHDEELLHPKEIEERPFVGKILYYFLVFRELPRDKVIEKVEQLSNMYEKAF